MKTKRFLLFLCLLVTACGSKGDRSPVIASINGRNVHQAEFEHYLALRLGEFSPEETAAPLRSGLLDEYLIRQLVIAEAARAGLEVSDAEVAQAAQESPQKKSAASDEGARKELEDDLLIEKFYAQKVLRDVRVSQEEVDSYIESHKDQLTNKPGFYVREIRVHTREKAEELRRQLVDGKADFAALARANSNAPNADQGGLARYDEGQMPAVLENAVRPLGPGAVSPVVQSSYGFHIFQLERRTQPYAPEERRSQLDERRTRLKEGYIADRNQEAVKTAVDRLAAAARVNVNQQALGFSYEGRFGHN